MPTDLIGSIYSANFDGTSALLQACRAAGLGRFVFVSSQSARPDAANVYGRVKWRIEQVLAGDREVSARVGLVYGGPPRAMFGLLSRLTARLPVLPMIDPWREVQPIHIDEVCEGLLRLDGEFAAATPKLMARAADFQARLDAALNFTKPQFNESMRSGHANM